MAGHGHGHGEHGVMEGRNKIIALVIAVIALFLAFSETLGKSAQTGALSYNIEASNLWAFFQAKTVRATTLRTASEALQVEARNFANADAQADAAKRIDAWRKTAARYETEPDTQEGRKELAARAKKAEENYKTAMARYHHYEVASAAFQIGIVLASATVITGMIALTYLAVGLGVLGIIFMGIGLLAPHAVHFV
jgi:flagellar basal body rod protein FlgC